MQVILDQQERNQLVNLIGQWVEAVPNPDDPIVSFAGSAEVYSPRGLAQAVRDGTEFGNKYVQSLAKIAFKDLVGKKFNS